MCDHMSKSTAMHHQVRAVEILLCELGVGGSALLSQERPWRDVVFENQLLGRITGAQMSEA